MYMPGMPAAYETCCCLSCCCLTAGPSTTPRTLWPVNTQGPSSKPNTLACAHRYIPSATQLGCNPTPQTHLSGCSQSSKALRAKGQDSPCRQPFCSQPSRQMHRGQAAVVVLLACMKSAFTHADMLSSVLGSAGSMESRRIVQHKQPALRDGHAYSFERAGW
jgi:hypothetical protein